MDWVTRLKIALDATWDQIIHRLGMPNEPPYYWINIFKGKVAEFGISELTHDTKNIYVPTQVKGNRDKDIIS